MSLNLNVNGKQFSVDAEPDTPLLWVLRDELKLVGTKFGCGQAVRGVHGSRRRFADPFMPDEPG